MGQKTAYSVMQIKSISEDSRKFKGIATTPALDSYNDIVVSEGAEFELPIPLLWQHNHNEPIGNVTKATITPGGIEIEGEILKASTSQKLKERLDEAWESIKIGLVKGLSIGFSPLEYSFPDEIQGVKYLRWKWNELSCVTIPANTEATITAIKAASGCKAKTKNTGDSVSIKKPIPKGENMKTIAEQIADFQAARVEKTEAMNAIMKKANDAGLTLDAEQSEQFDTLESEIQAIDKHIERLKTMEKAQLKSAKPVTDTDGGQKSTDVQKSAGLQVRAKNTQKLDAGIAFARAAKCLALGHLEHRDATQIAKALYDGQDGVINATQQLVTKAAVAPALTTTSGWAGALVGTETNAFADFVEYLRPQTILGKFGTDGIPALRNTPFRVPLIGQTSGGDGYWVGEGAPKPLTKFDFERKSLDPLKVANIAVASMEVIRDSSPAADIIIRDSLAAALRERLDIDFIDPAKTASSGVSPASILNGLNAIPSSGNDVEEVLADIKALFGVFIAANNAPTSGVWVMGATTALALGLMQNALGQPAFPEIGMHGGKLSGLPVIVSEYVPFDTNGGIVALVNASDIYLGDDGGIDVSMSTEASLQMDNAPDNPATASTVMVSLWQNNLVGFRAERTINWARRRASSAAYLTGVNWGA